MNKNRLKILFKKLLFFPYSCLWIRQQKLIQKLRNDVKEAERWVAISDYHHGLAEELADSYKRMNKHSENIIELDEKQIKNLKELVELHERRAKVCEEQIENLKNICRMHGANV